MCTFPNLWPNKKMFRINQPFGIQIEFTSRIKPITRTHIFTQDFYQTPSAHFTTSFFSHSNLSQKRPIRGSKGTDTVLNQIQKKTKRRTPCTILHRPIPKNPVADPEIEWIFLLGGERIYSSTCRKRQIKQPQNIKMGKLVYRL